MGPSDYTPKIAGRTDYLPARAPWQLAQCQRLKKPLLARAASSRRAFGKPREPGEINNEMISVELHHLADQIRAYVAAPTGFSPALG